MNAAPPSAVPAAPAAKESSLMLLGLVVNPIAGMGGRLGLKGTDGDEIRRLAEVAGASHEAPVLAVEALAQLASLRGRLKVLTAGGDAHCPAGQRPELTAATAVAPAQQSH